MARLPRTLFLVGAMTGATLGPIVLGGKSRAPARPGIDFKKATYAGIGGGVCGTAGLMVGTLLAGPRRYD
jgi:hypothetical protein